MSDASSRARPVCNAEGCDRDATAQVDGVRLDGKLFALNVCEQCAAEMDRAAGGDR
jgi:protein-arginine kinase activator protein McsA